MEAATPLRQPHVRTIGDNVAVDGLVVDDPGAVRLVRAREEAGEDTVRALVDAIEIGARVLDREQAGANTEFVRAEFEKASRDVEAAFEERARAVAEQFGSKVDEVFGPDSGTLSKALERHFSDGSSTAVQHRVKAVVEELMARSREDLQRLFSADDGANPLAGFQKAAIATMKHGSERQDTALRALLEKLGALELEVQKLHAERDKQLELDVERERGTAKGRTFEEEVHEAIDRIAIAQGDACDAVGDLKGATGRTGDVTVDIDGCKGPARGRIVFEAKDKKMSRPEMLRELDRAMAERDADFAVLVVASEEKLPAKTLPLREYNGDKLVVAHDPEDGSPIGLQVAYSLARARVLMARGEGEGIDAAALRDTVERALAAMDDVRKVKSQLSGATTSIEKAREIVETMAARVREHLVEIDALLAPVADAGAVQADPAA
jgi:hypothetical protein